ncbi:Alpha/beta hydrolase family protein [Geodermatophilus obscurus]|uniref:Alpha/beta hydrolase family protein n=1 Tax=Geodermatophilus obscurus TaxID=1861 RepID=A0A1M7TK75_9ACTN|nr:alpha/beta hydrolase [Geodermatophilus obscurus]SHN71096.1 Alpha/beta hydrolase family protein [Geodermatophilus obscurus]
MATETAPTLPPRSVPPPPRRGPIRWVVATSLGVGLAAALVLVLVVVAGAREHVITGSALLGFALGWAVLAVLSIRLTTRPQRWAFVPAAGMAATGLGLLVLAPGDAGLTAAGWVWPAVLLALAVWMGVRIRRDLAAGCGRGLLALVVAVMAVAAVVGMAETVAVAGHRSSASPGQSHDVGGYRLHLDCTGSGSPTVVLQGGLGSMSSSWARIAPAVSRTTRVCAYDRAGQGWSDDSPHAPDGLQAAADLHTLLDRAGEHGPYVLVGHSTGGSYAMTYAARHPRQVAGVVLLDSADPYQVTTASGSADLNAPAELALLPSLARLGIGQLVPASVWSSLPEPAAGQVAALTTSPRGWRNVRNESAAMPALFGQAQALITLGSTPLVVLTAAGHDGNPRWSAAQERMAALSTNSSHRHADATHNALLDEERGAQASGRAIDDVIRAVRTGTPVEPT